MSAVTPTVLTADAPSEGRDGPAGIEWWLTYAALLAVALVPAIGKVKAQDSTSSSPLAEVLWTVIYVLAVSRLLIDRDGAAALFRRSVVLWAFVSLMVLSTLWSVNPLVTFKNSVELCGTTIVAYYLVVRYPLRRLLDLLGLAFGTIAGFSLLFIVFAPGRGRMDWGSGAWTGVFQEKNNLGTAMVLASITLAFSLFTGSRGRKLLTAAMLFLCLGLLAGSRSATASVAGFVAMALAFVAWLWCSPRCGASGRLLMAGSGALLVVLSFLFGLRPDAMIEWLGRNGTLTGRTDFWPYLVQAVGDRSLLGYGYNAFFRSPEGSDYLSYYVVEAGGWTPYHAHNSFLQIGLDAGFVGLALLLLLLLVALVRAVRYVATQRRVIAAWPLTIMLYLVLGSYTETYLANFNSFEWIFFVAALLYPIHAADRGLARAHERLAFVGVGTPATLPRGSRPSTP